MCSHRLLRSLLCSSSSSSSFFFSFSFSSFFSFSSSFFSWFFWLALSKKRLHPREAFMQMQSLYARPLLSSLLCTFFCVIIKNFMARLPTLRTHARTYAQKRSSCHKTSLKARTKYICAFAAFFKSLMVNMSWMQSRDAWMFITWQRCTL